MNSKAILVSSPLKSVQFRQMKPFEALENISDCHAMVPSPTLDFIFSSSHCGCLCSYNLLHGSGLVHVKRNSNKSLHSFLITSIHCTVTVINTVSESLTSFLNFPTCTFSYQSVIVIKVKPTSVILTYEHRRAELMFAASKQYCS